MRKYNFFNGERLLTSLSESENLYYHRKYRLGDINAREILIKCNLKLVISVVINTFGAHCYELEDLIAIGVEGLIKGIEKFDESKSNKISSYFSGCIIYEILHFLRSENKYKKRGIELISIDDLAMEKDGCIIYNSEILNVGNESIEDVVIDKMMKKYYKKIIYEMLFELGDRDKTIFMLSYGFLDGKLYKQDEIAEIVGVNRGVVSMVLSRGLKKMRNRLLLEESRTYCRFR